MTWCAPPTATGCPTGCWPGSAARTTRSTRGCGAWDGTWTTLVITSVGTDARTRAALRTTLQDKRFGELREGVWMRPDNLDIELAAEIARPGAGAAQPATTIRPELAAQLWDLPAWAAHRRPDCSTRCPPPTDIPGRFVAAAGDGAAPAHRPGAARRAAARRLARRRSCAQAYHDFAAELVARRDDDRTDGGDMTDERRRAGRAQRPGDHGDHEPAAGAQRGQRTGGRRAVRRVRGVRRRRHRVGRRAVGRQRNLLRRSRSQGVRHTGRQPGAPHRARARWARPGWCCPSR